jgi:hypothetical protein
MPTYKLNKTKNYIKSNNLIFFLNGINKNSNDWVITEQKLKTLKLNYYKIFNKTTIKALKNSIYFSTIPMVYGIVFFIKPQTETQTLAVKNVSTNLESLFFTVLALKLNNKVYSAKQLKSNNSFKYKENGLLTAQFYTTNLKLHFKT